MTRAEKQERNIKMRAFVKEGHSREEAAEKYGVAVGTAKEICRGLGQCIEITYRNQYTNGQFDGEENARHIIEERAPGFEYVDGYTGADNKVNVRCKVCGTVTSRSMITIRHKSAVCRTCEERKHQERQEQERQKRDRERLKVEFQKAVVNYKVQKFNVCKCCNGLFIGTGKQIFCSAECRKRYNDAKKKDRRIRKIKEVQKDVIDIKRLYERDKGICHLCGGLCDWNDYIIKNGVFIAGNSYPSIDHITPISRNGEHSWTNVKLAHRICNTRRMITQHC